jgi:hypothetical protein
MPTLLLASQQIPFHVKIQKVRKWREENQIKSRTRPRSRRGTEASLHKKRLCNATIAPANSPASGKKIVKILAIKQSQCRSLGHGAQKQHNSA